MSAFAAALRALPLTFLLYLVEAAAALLTALPLGLELLSDERGSLRNAAGRAAWLDRSLDLLPALRVAGHSALVVGALLLLLSPWLHMAWLSALARPTSVRRALEHGARHYLRAALISLLMLGCLALGLAPWAGTLWLCDALLASSARVRLHDTLLVALALPCLWVLWTAQLAHDLARARALTGGVWSSVSFGLRSALRPRLQLPALLLLGATLTLRALHYYVFQQGPRLDAVSTTALLQGSCFAALFVRSLWLGVCLTCVERSATSGEFA